MGFLKVSRSQQRWALSPGGPESTGWAPPPHGCRAVLCGREVAAVNLPARVVSTALCALQRWADLPLGSSHARQNHHQIQDLNQTATMCHLNASLPHHQPSRSWGQTNKIHSLSVGTRQVSDPVSDWSSGKWERQ